MTSKEALKKLFFDNKDLHVDIVLNDRNVCEIYNTIKQDLERLEKLEEKIKELKSIIEEQSLKIANDSKEMSNMDLQIRQLKGEFMPLDCLK